MTPTRMAPEDRKGQIIRAGIDIAAETHIHHVTHANIAARIGCSRGTVYLYFRDSEALISAVVTAAHTIGSPRIMAQALAMDHPRSRMFSAEERVAVLNYLAGEGPHA